MSVTCILAGGVPSSAAELKIASVNLRMSGAANVSFKLLNEDIPVVCISSATFTSGGKLSMTYDVLDESIVNLVRTLVAEAARRQGRAVVGSLADGVMRRLVEKEVKDKVEPLLRQLVIDNKNAIEGIDLAKALTSTRQPSCERGGLRCRANCNMRPKGRIFDPDFGAVAALFRGFLRRRFLEDTGVSAPSSSPAQHLYELRCGCRYASAACTMPGEKQRSTRKRLALRECSPRRQRNITRYEHTTQQRPFIVFGSIYATASRNVSPNLKQRQGCTRRKTGWKQELRSSS